MARKITIELFPAGNGDAILLDLSDELLLIDCGYRSTYRDHLKPRLEQLHQMGRRLTKFIVTHIDADHISGAIAFIEENGPSDNPLVIGIDEVWFNSYRHLSFKDKEEGVFTEPPPGLIIRGGFESVETNDPSGLVSYTQGTSLGSQIVKNGYNWNTTFFGLAVKADNPLKITLDSGAVLTLLGPTQECLDKMAKKWYQNLKKIFKGKINEDAFFDDAFELMMEEMRQAELDSAATADQEAQVSGGARWVENFVAEWELEDTSLTNGSSITFLVEHLGRKLLFPGDAIPSEVITQLKKLVPNKDLPLQLDVFKVAHHGAWSNNSPDLINMIRAKYYLFSSNGLRHHHPNFATMAEILRCHGPSSHKTLVFNYKQGDRLHCLDHEDARNNYNYSVIWPDVDVWGVGDDGYVQLVLE